ncbi:hypothetical protein K438DRAFT_406843 [Mycena galopus ATCC 62051]|nr:hypothetical protein K438DRAFT_406843 [Mycena galopus ATCC 62051]
MLLMAHHAASLLSPLISAFVTTLIPPMISPSFSSLATGSILDCIFPPSPLPERACALRPQYVVQLASVTCPQREQLLFFISLRISRGFGGATTHRSRF